MSEVTNDTNSRSTIDEESFVPKRKTRRVRSLIKTSTEKILSDKNTRRHSTTSLTDKRPFPFGQCRVCMDKATGAHYGVPTCEGCKGFFKRSILRKEKYRCYFGDRCIVNTDNRNRCKSCRFQKCLKEGMSVEGVRMGRIPKLVKEKALAEHHLSSSSTENDDPNSTSCLQSLHSSHLIPIDIDLEFFDEEFFSNDFDSLSFEAVSLSPERNLLDETISTSDDDFLLPNSFEYCQKLGKILSQSIIHANLNDEQLEFIKYLRRQSIDLVNTCNEYTQPFIDQINSINTLHINEFSDDQNTLQDILAGLADAIPFHVKNLITFSRQTQALNEIDIEDFNKIINNRLFDFWLIKHSPLLRNNQSYIILPNRLQYTRQWMLKILGKELVETIFEFAERFHQLNLTSEEYALIFPVIICRQDMTLNDQEAVSNIRSCYLYALYAQLLTTRTQSEAETVLKSLLQILALLPILNELQARQVPDDLASDL